MPALKLPSINDPNLRIAMRIFSGLIALCALGGVYIASAFGVVTYLYASSNDCAIDPDAVFCRPGVPSWVYVVYMVIASLTALSMLATTVFGAWFAFVGRQEKKLLASLIIALGVSFLLLLALLTFTLAAVATSDIDLEKLLSSSVMP